jgi:general secretion pathway protein D
MGVRRKEMRLMWLLCGVLFIFNGCATTRERVKEEGAPASIVKALERSDRRVYVDKGAGVKVEKTPLGYVKEQVESEKVEEKQIVVSAPEPPAPSTPAAGFSTGVPASPAAIGEPSLRETKKNKVSEDEGGRVEFNFDEADLYEVIRTMAEILKINYIAEPGIKGSVTIHTAGRLREKDLFPIFFQILEVNGLTAVKEGNLYRIMKMKDAPRLPLTSRIGKQGTAVPPEERIIIQIIPLTFISAAELAKIITPFVSADGTVVTHADTNTIVLVDKGSNVLKTLKLIEAFDIDLFERLKYRFYQVNNLEAEELAKVLTEIFPPPAGAGKADLKFIAIKRLNLVLAVSSNPRIFDRVEEAIRLVDVPSEQMEPRIFVYFVKNGEAKQLAELLDSVFKEGELKSKSDKKDTGKPKNPLLLGYKGKEEPKEAPKGTGKAPEKTTAATQAEGEGQSGWIKGDIKITADEVRNALIIKASPRDYQVVERVLAKLDVLPRQVLIEVTIAEITLDDSTQLGVEWEFGKGTGTIDTNFAASVGNAGLKYALGVTDKWYAALSALASKNKVNILSSPSVLASDNKEARIDITTEIPVASSEYLYSQTSNNVSQTSIQYRDTGVILSVVPHINERGLVTMEIAQEVSEKADNVQVGGKDYPSFFKRAVETSLTVQHGQTIVIGGLIKETSSKGTSGLPWLVNVPIIRYLFGTDKDSISKTELIILITPHVITSLEDVDSVTDDFKGKVQSVLQTYSR